MGGSYDLTISGSVGIIVSFKEAKRIREFCRIHMDSIFICGKRDEKWIEESLAELREDICEAEIDYIIDYGLFPLEILDWNIEKFNNERCRIIMVKNIKYEFKKRLQLTPEQS